MANLPKTKLYAKLMAFCYKPDLYDNRLPDVWRIAETKNFWVTGAQAYVFVNDFLKEVVIAWKGQHPLDPRDMVTAFLRQRGVHYTTSYSFWVSKMVYKHVQIGWNLVFIGHSGGAGVATWLGWIYDCAVYAFEGGAKAQRTTDAIRNPGEKLVSIWVRGSRFGDGDVDKEKPPIPGEKIILEPLDSGGATLDDHLMPNLLTNLESYQGEPT